MAEPLSGTLGADFSKFVDECAKATAALQAIQATSDRMVTSLDKVAASTESNTVSFTKLTSSYVSGEAIIKGVEAAWESLTGFMSDAINAASESETVNVKLMAALQAQGNAMPSVIAAYDGYAQQLQRVTTYSDDTVRAAEGVLVTIGNVMPKDMKAALDASADLAAGLGIDLPQAATMLSKAIEGNEGALKKAGITFDDTKGKVVSFDEILGRVNDKFSGQASAAADTYAGKLAQLENAWSSLLGAVGRVVTQNETIRTAISLVTTAIGENTTELNANKTANNLVSDAVIGFAKALDLGLAALGFFAREAFQFESDVKRIASTVLSYAATIAEAFQTIGAMDPTGGFFTPGFEQQLVAATTAAANFRAKAEELAAASADAHDRGAQWSETIVTLRGGLADMIGKLEETRGGVVANTRAQTELTGAWDRGTTSRLGLAAANAAADAAAKKAAAEAEAAAKQQAATIAAMAALQADYVAEVGKGSVNVTQAQINNAWAAADAQVAAMTRAKTLTIEAYDLIMAKAQATTDNIIAKRLDEDKSTQDYYSRMMMKAQEAYDFALDHAEHYTAEAINKLRDTRDQAADTLTWWQEAANASLESVGNTAQETANTIDQINKELQTLKDKSIEVEKQRQADIQKMIADWHAIKDMAFPTSAAMPPGSQVVTDQYGGQSLVGPNGQSVNLVRGAGALSGGMVLPAGWESSYYNGVGFNFGGAAAAGKAGNTVNMQPGAVTMNYPIMNDPQAMDQIGRVVGDAVMSRVTRSGSVV